jgi:lipopolysaccharide heptosyltransferase I
MTHHPALAELNPARVCLIKPSSLGDVVHALPVLSALRRLWPRAHIAWVVNRGLRGLIEGHPELSEVIPFDRSRARATIDGLMSMACFLQELRRRRFDLTIDLQGLLRSGLMGWATGARVRVGLAEAREGASRFYTHRVPTLEGSIHMVDRMLRVSREFGASVDSPSFLLPPNENARAWARSTLRGMPRPRLVLNVGARWLTKRWPPSRFAEIARRADRELGAGLIAVGAPEDRPLIESLKLALGPSTLLDLCGRTDLPQLAALAAESDVFLSNDTGPLHLALAAGTHAVGVYTCSDPRKTGPYGDRGVAVATQVWCSASCLKRCPRMECMGELTPDRVWPAVRLQLTRALRDLPGSAGWPAA